MLVFLVRERDVSSLGYFPRGGDGVLKEVGTTKVVNLSSNIAALVTFAISGNIDYRIGIPCALSSIAGGYIGSGLAVRNGAKVIKPMLVVVLALLLVKVVVNLFVS
jgi:uncharacterized membrane protein YfcA